MSVDLSADGTIVLEGNCSIDDAEKLLQYLIVNPGAAVDWTQCAAMHTSVVQVLLAAKPALWGPPSSDFLRMHVEPLLTQIPDGNRNTAQGI